MRGVETATVDASAKILRVTLAEDSRVRLEQVRAIDMRQMTRQVGVLERKQLNAALSVLREMFAE